MNSHGKSSGSMFGKFSGIFGGKRSIETQMQKYMEFYYPSTGQFVYHVTFDWGEYTITTEAKLGETVHQDSKPYVGYITLRPKVVKPTSDINPAIYLITPTGEVWKTSDSDKIPKLKEREEVTEEKSNNMTTINTLTIQSVSEPVIDHFRAHPQSWARFGKLINQGKKVKLSFD